MRDYARQQTALLLERLAVALDRAARGGDADSIHDIRVAMRRLSRCLRIFAPFYANQYWKKIRRRIAALMAAAGAVRDCDIAIELVCQAGVARRSPIVAQLAAQRRKTGQELLLEIRRWKSRDFPRRWRDRLELQAPAQTTAKIGAPVRNPSLAATRSACRQLPVTVHDYFLVVRKLLAADPPPAELHTVRLATKRLRYTLELFRPCYGPGLEIRLASLQGLQKVLGEINDCAAAERLIVGLAPASAARKRIETFLRRRASVKAVALRKEWHDSFDAPGREHWWIQYLSKKPKSRKARL
jgi:CHAD domain-containing protein